MPRPTSVNLESKIQNPVVSGLKCIYPVFSISYLNPRIRIRIRVQVQVCISTKILAILYIMEQRKMYTHAKNGKGQTPSNFPPNFLQQRTESLWIPNTSFQFQILLFISFSYLYTVHCMFQCACEKKVGSRERLRRAKHGRKVMLLYFSTLFFSK